MQKILIAPRCGPVVERMSRAGLLSFLGVAPWPARLQRFLDRKTPDSLLALAALTLHSEADAERLTEALRLSNAQKRRLAAMAVVAAGWHGADKPPEPACLLEALFVHGAQAARDGLALIQAESPAEHDDSDFSQADVFLRDTPAPKLPVGATDLIARGVAQGPALGRALKRLTSLWIRAGFPQEPQIVARLIDEAAGTAPDEDR
jgi:poly(A) polymerase